MDGRSGVSFGMRRHTGARRLHLMRFAVVALVIAPAVLVPAAARADTICGPSGGHTLCVTTPPGTPIPPAFGKIRGTRTNMRELQFALKYLF